MVVYPIPFLSEAFFSRSMSLESMRMVSFQILGFPFDEFFHCDILYTFSGQLQGTVRIDPNRCIIIVARIER